MRPLAMLSLCALLLAATTACDPRTSRQGEDEQLLFSYQSADNRRDFERPIAQGASLFVTVQGAEEEPVSRITAVSSSAEQVMSARRDASRQNQVVLTGLAPGKSTLRVSAELEAGGSRSDSVPFTVARAAKASVAHTCIGTRDAAYIVGFPVELDFQRQSSSGERLVGHGGCNIGLSPEGIVPGMSCDETRLVLQGTQQTGTLELDTRLPSIPDTTGRLTLQIVSSQLLDFAPVQDQLIVGQTETVSLRPQTADWPICTRLDLQVEIVSTQTCRGANSSDRVFQVSAEERNQLGLRGVRAGDCVFRVSLPGLERPDIWEFSIPVFEQDER